MAAPSAGSEEPRHVVSRREFVKMMAVAGAASAVRIDAAAAAAVRPFRVPLRIPPVLRPIRRTDDGDVYETIMRRSRVPILPGKLTPAWTFDGSFPGPTIKVTRGTPAIVRRVNRLRVPTTIHLHGGRVRPSSDGQPTDLIQPGDRKDYVYPNEQEAATLWYHDHTHHHASRNNYMGLSGLYIIEDDAESELNLPSGKYDIPLFLQDRRFKRDGSFRFHDGHNNVRGDTFLVNGRPTPFLEVANRKYRFRIVNASNSRGYQLVLGNGEPLVQIATDGGLLPTPQPTVSLPVWPAERAEVVIDFSRYPVGTKIELQHRADPADAATAQPVMRFDVVREEEDPSSLPMLLRSFEPITQWAVEREFLLEFDQMQQRWEINGKAFDPKRVDVEPRLGDAELWTFRNNSSVRHPMHVHLVRFHVVNRSNLVVGPGDIGWKDTVRVDPSSTVSVAMRFDSYAGRYMFHCHNLAHEDHSMMGQMKIVPAG